MYFLFRLSHTVTVRVSLFLIITTSFLKIYGYLLLCSVFEHQKSMAAFLLPCPVLKYYLRCKRTNNFSQLLNRKTTYLETGRELTSRKHISVITICRKSKVIQRKSFLLTFEISNLFLCNYSIKLLI